MAEEKVRVVFCIVTYLHLLVNDWLWDLFYRNITLNPVYVCNISSTMTADECIDI